MVKTRRSLKDYEEAVERFEEFLEVREDKSLVDIETSQELVQDLENWFGEIEVPNVHQSSMAQSMIAWMLESRQLGKQMRTKPKVIRIRKKVRLLRQRDRWTRRELGLLRHRYQRPNEYSVDNIAKSFGRSKKAIYNKARRLKLKRKMFEVDEGDV